MPSFCGQLELSAQGLHLQQQDQSHPAISHCCQACSQVGVKGAIIPPILDCKYANIQMLSRNCHDRIKPSIHSKLLAKDCLFSVGNVWKYLALYVNKSLQ